MGASRRPSEPEKVPAAAPARPSALELKVEELEEKGLIRVLRGPGDTVSIEIVPGAVATPSGGDVPTPKASMDSFSPGVQEHQAGGGRSGPGRGSWGHIWSGDLDCVRGEAHVGAGGLKWAVYACVGQGGGDKTT
jgi:hypothetical protein